MTRQFLSIVPLVVLTLGCGKQAPAAPGASGPSAFPGTPPAPPARPAAVSPSTPAPPPEAPVVAPPAITATPLADPGVDLINEQGLLRPALFAYDSDELDAGAREALEHNARLLRQNATWVVTIEGHCDERGTPEYNLALGDRRALAARNYLQSLGISADRLKTVSYGEEFPFDSGHDEKAWSANRRAHFMVTAR